MGNSSGKDISSPGSGAKLLAPKEIDRKGDSPKLSAVKPMNLSVPSRDDSIAAFDTPGEVFDPRSPSAGIHRTPIQVTIARPESDAANDGSICLPAPDVPTPNFSSAPSIETDAADVRVITDLLAIDTSIDSSSATGGSMHVFFDEDSLLDRDLSQLTSHSRSRSDSDLSPAASLLAAAAAGEKSQYSTPLAVPDEKLVTSTPKSSSSTPKSSTPRSSAQQPKSRRTLAVTDGNSPRVLLQNKAKHRISNAIRRASFGRADAPGKYGVLEADKENSPAAAH